MRLREAARTRLPAQVQDALRLANDVASPRRRRARSRGAVDKLAMMVSPNDMVLAGPFAGLRLSPEASWGGAAARLAGTYEEELHDVVVNVIERRPRRIVDIGAAEGYYAVGFARSLASAQVVSFEIDPLGRSVTRRNARQNAVRNLRIRGRATPGALSRTVGGGACVTVLCDCEGYEEVLIDPDEVPGLRRAVLIVELHEFAVPGVTDLLVRRFDDSHDVDLITAVPRTAVNRPQLAHLSRTDAQRAVEEGRPTDPPMQWAVMMPRRG